VIALWLKVDTTRKPVSDAYGWALAFLVLGIPFLMLMPKLGAVLIGSSVACLLFGRYARA
jgi:hypothetical protein